MKNILVISDIYFETQYFLENIPQAEEFQVASDVSNTVGSKTLNAARVLTNLGNQVALWGKVGADGMEAIKRIKQYGIDSNSIEVVSNSKTGQITVQTDSTGKSSITLYFGANNEIFPKDFIRLEEEIRSSDFIYAATNLPLESLYTLVDICSSNNKAILIDFPNQQKLVKLERLSSAEFLVPNRQEAELLLDIKIESVSDAFEALKLIREKCSSNIVISLDKDGCVSLEKASDKPVHIPTTEVKAIDSTGSGDILRGAFVSIYLTTKNIQYSLVKAMKLATESAKMRGVDYTIKNLDYKTMKQDERI